MKVSTLNSRMSIVALFVSICIFFAGNALAEGTKVAVIDMQKVVLNSNFGKAAQIDIEKRVKELEESFKKDEQALMDLQEEIEKKSSVWSEEVKQEKGLEFQKLRRDMRIKQDDANAELKQLQDKKLAPIFEKLEGVVREYAKEKGYEIILPGQAVLYAVESVDITNAITQALNEEGK